jgi:hypothetical protein
LLSSAASRAKTTRSENLEANWRTLLDIANSNMVLDGVPPMIQIIDAWKP